MIAGNLVHEDAGTEKPADCNPRASKAFNFSGPNSKRSGGRLGGDLPARRLDDHAVADGLGADLHANDLAVNHGADLLNIRLELAGGDPGDLGADPAQILRLAAMGDLVAEGGLLAGEVTN